MLLKFSGVSYIIKLKKKKKKKKSRKNGFLVVRDAHEFEKLLLLHDPTNA
jgi:hypothetical protein